jgi:hypothetical protein
MGLSKEVANSGDSHGTRRFAVLSLYYIPTISFWYHLVTWEKV